MKRFHVHLGVPDLAASIRFYSDLFGMPPSVAKPDYAKWMLDDPRVNFAISQRGALAGLNHLGLQADSAEELADLRSHFAAADGASVHDENGVSCCYARSNKHWVRDPQGIAWEAFHSLGTVPLFGGDADDAQSFTPSTSAAGGCCAPAGDSSRQEASTQSGCCSPARSAVPATTSPCC